jgi:hypothetical protein
MKVRMMKVSVVCLMVLVTASTLPAAAKKRTVSTIDPITRMNNRTPEELMDLTVKTLEFVQKARKSPKLAVQVAAMQKRLAAGKGDKAFLAELAKLRRRIILSHPSLDFETLLINKRPPTLYNHAQEQYVGRHSRAGDGLVLLKNWKTAPAETVLLAGKLPRGSVMHPDLSFDGKKVLFSYCDHTDNRREFRQHFIYEIGIDGKGLRRVTGNKNDKLERAEGRRSVLIEDFDPCYLPDGGFAFISTRCQSYGRCHGGRYTPSYMLYRGNLDGSGIKQLSFGEANEWDPSVMADGRIIYTRWDYIDRDPTPFQSLWVTKTDGTATALYYGNYTGNPHMTAEPRSIPGLKKVMTLAVAHHSYSSGSVILVDRSKGDEGLKPLTRITPEVRFPETENNKEPGSYTNPWPLSEDLFLVSYMPDRLAYQFWMEKNRPDKVIFQRPSAYAIYLIDTLGGRELIYRDPDMSSVAPIPVRPRKTPPVLPSFINTPEARKSTTGVCYVQDVYQSTAKIPTGEIKWLRVNKIFGQPVARPRRRGQDGELLAKKVLGTVPVNANGSAAFRVPAGIPLQLQALDENGMCVMNMRSFIYLHPGEKLSCTGCHESRTSPPVAKPMGKITVRDLTPPPWKQEPGKGFSFDKVVKPVLDRYCIKCHGLDPKKPKGEKNLNFCGSRSSAFALLRDKTLVFTRRRARSTYKDSLSHAGRLGPLMLKRQKGKNKLDPASFARIITWLDLSGQYYGDYSWNRIEDRKPSKEGEAALREHIRATFGQEVSKAPYAALVNVADVDESRILKAPLAKSAGGWAQIAGGWKSVDDKGYQKMKKLAIASIEPMAQRDIETTCNLPDCKCGSCWVRTRKNSPQWQFYTNNYSKDFKRIDPSGDKE